ncbi:MAG TPA: SIMPL domain-containing protein [Gammaproteobacteria bacterium]|nr:SIMPL domain-containing protein [Gammaproteobacteria bacterium]
MISRLFFLLLLAGAVVLPVTVSAHEGETLFNVVNLQAQVERQIPNNQMVVILATEHEGSNPASISKEINRDMQWALDTIKTYEGVDSKTGNYQTYPVYNKQTITGWRSSQQVELKSMNMDGLTELAGKLQERLQIKQMVFSPTDDTRKQYENALIEEAMEAFKERIAIVGKHMEQNNHRIVTININTGGSQPPVMFGRAAMKTMAMESAVSPAVEAGMSSITVTVNGSVQFF